MRNLINSRTRQRIFSKNFWIEVVTRKSRDDEEPVTEGTVTGEDVTKIP